MNIIHHHFFEQNKRRLFSQIMIELVDSEQKTETELNLPKKKKLIFTSVCFKFLSFLQVNLILVPFPPQRQVLSIILQFNTCFTRDPCYIFYFKQTLLAVVANSAVRSQYYSQCYFPHKHFNSV